LAQSSKLPYGCVIHCEGEGYSELPRTIIINIIAFELFDCKEFHSEFQALEVTRHTQLTDKMSLHYYELPKLPESINVSNNKELWLKLFKAETEEELANIEALEAGRSAMRNCSPMRPGYRL